MHSQRARRGSKMFSPPARSSITAKWSGHRGNIVMPPPCIHTAGHNCRHHTAGTTAGTTLQGTTQHCSGASCSGASLIVKVWPSTAAADCRRAAAAAAGSLLALINGNPVSF